MASETSYVTSSQDPAVPSGPSVRRRRRGLFCFVFCFLKASKRPVIYCSIIKAFLHLFDFGIWYEVFPGKCLQKVLEGERVGLGGKL